MIIIKEEDLSKLEDIGLTPKYDEDTGKIDKYITPDTYIEVYTTDTYFGVHQNPYIWKLNVSMYGRDNSILDELYDILGTGLFHRVDSLKELKSIIDPTTEDNTEEPGNTEGTPVNPV